MIYKNQDDENNVSHIKEKWKKKKAKIQFTCESRHVPPFFKAKFRYFFSHKNFYVKQ